MPIAKIRDVASAALSEAGYAAGTWAWIDGPNRLIQSVRGQLCTVKLPGGMARAKLERAIGYLQGLAEGARIKETTSAV